MIYNRHSAPDRLLKAMTIISVMLSYFQVIFFHFGLMSFPFL
jgi:hypothetical protein